MTDEDDAKGLWRNSDPDTSREAAQRALREYHWRVARRIMTVLLIEYPAVSARMVREAAAEEGFDAKTAESIRRRVHERYQKGDLICVGKSFALGGMLFIFRTSRSKRPPKSKRPRPPLE